MPVSVAPSLRPAYAAPGCAVEGVGAVTGGATPEASDATMASRIAGSMVLPDDDMIWTIIKPIMLLKAALCCSDCCIIAISPGSAAGADGPAARRPSATADAIAATPRCGFCTSLGLAGAAAATAPSSSESTARPPAAPAAPESPIAAGWMRLSSFSTSCSCTTHGASIAALCALAKWPQRAPGRSKCKLRAGRCLRHFCCASPKRPCSLSSFASTWPQRHLYARTTMRQ